ncbi:MAG: serine/threonine protein kinase [Myxococcales bacterium]|nr:serine/threonine protein kinase [Myxococcales bacterium]
MIGELVGTYRIVSLLGAGGMGAVWLAEHTLLGRRVAIKFLLAEVSQNPTIVDRFFAEAKAATRIADPGIVVVYDFGWHTDGAAYIVMEHLAGESVQSRLRNGRFGIADAVRVVQQAAMVMAVAHGTGIIHRDLKPDNLFLVPDPAVTSGERIKILDFGIAKLLGPETDSGIGNAQGNPARTRSGVIMGTPTYMSPEQCRSAGEVDHRTDIYALGCVLFHLLCGRLPFVASTPGDMIAAHLRETPLAPSIYVPQIPITVDAIVMRCLAKNVDDRYATMTELARELAAVIGSLSEIPSIVPVRAPRPPNPTPTPPRAIAEAPPLVSRGADTAAGSGPLAAAPLGPLSTLASGAGESMPAMSRGKRIFGALLAVVALGAIVTTIVIATSKSTDSTRARPPAIQPTAPADAAVVAPVIDAPLDAGKAPADARKPRPRARGSDDPYATP